MAARWADGEGGNGVWSGGCKRASLRTRDPAEAVAEGLHGFRAADEEEGGFVLSQMREGAGGPTVKRLGKAEGIGILSNNGTTA